MAKFNVDKITVNQTKCFFDPKTGTKVYEKPYLMQYESQHFRCKAIIELDECIADRNWTIGLIQACDGMYLQNKYGGRGSSYWEFHPIKSGRHRMVNDSDGRQYPFYSVNSSKCEVTRGTVHNCVVKLQYADHFYPTVVWELPYSGGARLTEVIRRQDFWIWLVAVRRSGHYNRGNDVFHIGKDELYILRSMRWHYSLRMRFDPDAKVGKRLVSVSDHQLEQPSILSSDEPLPFSAVHPPHCNAAQSLIWYPKQPGGSLDLLVPPRQTVVPWDRWAAEMLPGQRRLQKPRDMRVCPLWSPDSRMGVSLVKLQQQQPLKQLPPLSFGSQRSGRNTWRRIEQQLVGNNKKLASAMAAINSAVGKRAAATA